MRRTRSDNYFWNDQTFLSTETENPKRKSTQKSEERQQLEPRKYSTTNRETHIPLW